jgi:hydrogenase maturation protein HypF
MAARKAEPALVERRLEVRGVVQGVGFRPFVWRLATRYDLRGLVRNASGVVEIVAEGPPQMIDAFTLAIAREAPTLSRIDDIVTSDDLEPSGASSFEVESSVERGDGERLVSPDVATCPSCLAELFDPADRRYRYPFINCTDCGPRFTIIEGLPYDRARTSMHAFPMCASCDAEYADPANRRFHAEPIACPSCGPTLRLIDATGASTALDAVPRAAAIILAGGIVALKGLGGFHLASDARSEDAVAELRRRKHRPDKPFAVMVADLDAARERFDLSEAEEAVLASPQAPIVLVRDRGTLATAVAPGHRRQGVMLPATPLHHLLLRDVGVPLVMTSGNRSDEPICVDDAEALDRLDGVADAFLVHDRAIVARYDDSVSRVWRGAPVLLRRARSFAPAPITLARAVVPTLGTGALLHGAFCLASGTRAYLSQHVGDLDTLESMAAYREAYDRYRSIFALEPERIAHDLHPDFLTTRFAEELGLPSIGVQHHRAHVAAVMAEHRITDPVIGVAFDGFGLGDDGGSWGGELFVGGVATLRRRASLRPVAQPGGDAAVREPWRMAVSYALDAGVLAQARDVLGVGEEDIDAVERQLCSNLSSPMTSSVGRLFDAVAAMTGVCRRATYEGQPAMLLEQVALGSATHEYPFDVAQVGELMQLDARPIVAEIVRDLERGRSAAEVAGRFHRTMAAATLELVRGLRGLTGYTKAVLAGGVFNNEILSSDLVARLESFGFEVYLPRLAPVGDGGIALGQVLIAGETEEVP